MEVVDLVTSKSLLAVTRALMVCFSHVSGGAKS